MELYKTYHYRIEESTVELLSLTPDTDEITGDLLSEGEGVVGLMQSFLIAGANGVSVSLWQAADRSTMELMTGLYSIVKEKGLTYAQALTEMKRAFIKHADYHDPFYRAPFVYYGN